MREFEFIDALKSRSPRADHVSVGIGDDAAVWKVEGNAVVAADMLVEGIHFEPSTPAEKIGRKLLAVNLSDFAAMAAVPQCAVVCVSFPKNRDAGFADRFADGVLALAGQFGVSLIGGDTTSGSDQLVASLTLFGVAPEGITPRNAARPGDGIFVTGALGGSIRGRHLDFSPRVIEARSLAAEFDIRSAVDLSDGLSRDIAHLLPGETGAIVFADRIPIHEDAALLALESNRTPLEHALHDGEDFELLFATADAPSLSGCPVTRIGEVTSTPGVRLVHPNGDSESLAAEGFEHDW